MVLRIHLNSIKRQAPTHFATYEIQLFKTFFKEMNPRTKSINYRSRKVFDSYEQGKKKMGAKINLPNQLEFKNKNRFIEGKELTHYK